MVVSCLRTGWEAMTKSTIRKNDPVGSTMAGSARKESALAFAGVDQEEDGDPGSGLLAPREQIPRKG